MVQARREHRETIRDTHLCPVCNTWIEGLHNKHVHMQSVHPIEWAASEKFARELRGDNGGTGRLPSVPREKDELELAAEAAEKAKRPAAPPKEKAPAREPQACMDGCGSMTTGSRFLPGHDAKLKSLLLKVNRGEAKKSDIPAVGKKYAEAWFAEHPAPEPVEKPAAAPKAPAKAKATA